VGKYIVANFQMMVLPRMVGWRGRRMAAADIDTGDGRGDLGEAAVVKAGVTMSYFLLTNQRLLSHTGSNYYRGLRLASWMSDIVAHAVKS
jgi:hypothetical protein